jgi:hypothetical protein
MNALDAEMERARAVLRTARGRMVMYAAAFNGAIDRDLERRLASALRRVRWLESEYAAALLIAS